jgi:hypothetical protein
MPLAPLQCIETDCICGARIGIGACGEPCIADYDSCGDHSMVDCDCARWVAFGESVAPSAEEADGRSDRGVGEVISGRIAVTALGDRELAVPILKARSLP